MSPGRFTRSRTFTRNGECLMATIDDSTPRRRAGRRAPCAPGRTASAASAPPSHAPRRGHPPGARPAPRPRSSASPGPGDAPARPYRSRSTASRRRRSAARAVASSANASRSAIRAANARAVSASPPPAPRSRAVATSSSHAASAARSPRRTRPSRVSRWLVRNAAGRSRRSSTTSTVAPPRIHSWPAAARASPLGPASPRSGSRSGRPLAPGVEVAASGTFGPCSSPAPGRE